MQDSSEGNTGIAKPQSAVQNYSDNSRKTNTEPGVSGGSYLPKANILENHPACAGYTIDNYTSRFEAHSKGFDVQLHAHCASAYNYYSMYLNAIRQGHSQQVLDDTYKAFHDSAQIAIKFHQTTR